MNTLANKIADMPTAVLITLARSANVDYRTGADDVLDALLKELETRVPSRDFVAFCDELAETPADGKRGFAA